MDRESVSAQFRIEKQLLDATVASLRQALEWPAEEQGAARKLSTIRYVADIFHRHLGRLMAIHEHDGYMLYITASNPELIPAVEALKRDHAHLREELGRIVTSLERVSPHDVDAVTSIYSSLPPLLRMYDAHSRRELHLVQEALLRDIGGAG